MLRKVLLAILLLLASPALANSIATVSASPTFTLALNEAYGPSSLGASAWPTTPTLVSGTETIYYTAATSDPYFAIGNYVNTTNFSPTGFNFVNLQVKTGTTVGSCPSSICTLVVTNGASSATYSSGGQVYPGQSGDTMATGWCSDNNTYISATDGVNFGAVNAHISLGKMAGVTTTSPPPTLVNGMTNWQGDYLSTATFKALSMLCIGSGGTDSLYYALATEFYPQVYNLLTYQAGPPTIVVSQDHGVSLYPDPTTAGLAFNYAYTAGLVPTSATLSNGLLTLAYTSTSLYPNATFRVGDSVFTSNFTTTAANGAAQVITPGTCTGTSCTGLVLQLANSVASASVTLGASPHLFSEYAPASFPCAHGCPTNVVAPMWPGTDAEPQFIEYGEGNSATFADGACCGGTLPDNAASYVYALIYGSPLQGTTLSQSYAYLARVPYGNGSGSCSTVSDISCLDSSQWQYYCGGDGSTTSNWTFSTQAGQVPTAAVGGGTGGGGLSTCSAIPVMSDPNYYGANSLGRLSSLGVAQYIPPSVATAGNGGGYLAIQTNFVGQLQPTNTNTPWTYGYLTTSSAVTAGAETINFPCSGSSANFVVGEAIAVKGVTTATALNTSGLGSTVSTASYATGICTVTFTNGAGTATWGTGNSGAIYPNSPTTDPYDTMWIGWQAPHPWGNGTGAWNTGTTVPWCKFWVQPWGGLTQNLTIPPFDGYYMPTPLVASLSADRTTENTIPTAFSQTAVGYQPQIITLTFTYNPTSTGNLCGF